MFFALKGPNFNANTLAESALKSGSKYAVIDEEEYYLDDRTILVDDALSCLQELARYHRDQLTIPVIGITGSNGKTTTKELIHAVLAQKYKVYATQGNYNNHIGVPLTLLAIKEDIEIAIIEMGANHAGEIEFLCNISDPNYGLITNIGKAHLEGFGSIEVTIETKTALYRHLAKNKGIAFVNHKDPLLCSMSENLNRIFYRTTELDGINIELNKPFLNFQLLLNGKGDERINTQLIGEYNLDNLLVAYSIGMYFDVPKADIILALEEYTPSNNRSQFYETKNNKLILDAYNANPSSTILAITNFAKLDLENKLVILGDMLELGENAQKEHQEMIDEISASTIDALLIGPIYSACKLGNGIKAFSTTEECKNYLINNNQKGRAILIKGSRGLKLESLVDAL
jgi:UDP-N-acetylmuramoyl-tripeptide--D-alanyl-D-alanine ligase